MPEELLVKILKEKLMSPEVLHHGRSPIIITINLLDNMNLSLNVDGVLQAVIRHFAVG